MCGSQEGKTDTTLNIICHRLDDDPVPTLYIGPTRSNVEKVIEPRLMAAIKSSHTLAATMNNRQKKSKTSKRVNGVILRLGWAGSASELASQEAGLAVLDEVDRMNIDVEGEGSPIELVDARLATFIDGLMVLTSTPTEGNVVEERHPTSGLIHWKLVEAESCNSVIWKMWQDGTRFEWAWPCPDCNDYFIPRFTLLKWPEGSTPSEARRKARMVCPHCGSMIEDTHKRWMNARGRFAAPGQSISKQGEVIGPVEDSDHFSFWISGLCSPWRSFGHRAQSYLSAVRSGDTNRIKTAVNTGLGELFRVGGDAPEWQAIKARAKGYALGEIPSEAIALTCGVDVQKDRLIYAVRAWGYSLESWLVEFNTIYGDPATPDPWDRLKENVLAKDYAGMTIRKCAIDSGYKPGEPSAEHIVYAFVRQNPGICVATKGHDTQDKPLYSSTIDVRESGKIIKAGMQLWHLNTDHFKSFIHGKLKQPEGQLGEWHIPVDVSDDYCQQIVAESRAMKASGRAVWVCVRKENHALDCDVNNVAAFYILGGHIVRRPKTQEQTEAATSGQPEISLPIEDSTKRQPARMIAPQHTNNWVKSWRR